MGSAKSARVLCTLGATLVAMSVSLVAHAETTNSDLNGIHTGGVKGIHTGSALGIHTGSVSGIHTGSTAGIHTGSGRGIQAPAGRFGGGLFSSFSRQRLSRAGSRPDSAADLTRCLPLPVQ